MKTVNKVLNDIFVSIVFLLMLVISSYSHACTATATPVSPALTSRTPIAGTGQIAYPITISINCTAGETYSITSTASSFFASVGATSQNIQGTYYADAGLTQLLYTVPLVGTAGITGTINLVVYGVLKGSVSGLFDGFGVYTLPMGLTVTSSGGVPISLSHTESGVVQGTCTIGNATVNFSNVTTGSIGLNQPVAMALNCTAGLPYSIAQPVVATVTIGGNSSNTGWIYAGAGSTLPLNTTPVLGNAVGTSQIINLYAGISGATQGSGIVGVGAISGVINVVVSY